MIKIKKLIFLLSLLLILTSCTSAKIVVPLEKYAEGPGVKEPEDETEIEDNVPDSPVQEFQIVGKSDHAVRTVALDICWRESTDDDCEIEPSNPRDRLGTSNSRLVVEKGENLSIALVQTLEKYSPSHRPYHVEMIQYYSSDEEGTVILSEPGEKYVYFKAPEEEGTYYYLYRVIWNKSEKKQVFYGFSLYVK